MNICNLTLHIVYRLLDIEHGEGVKRMKVRSWNSICLLVVVFSLIFISGCGTLETLVNKDGDMTSFEKFIGGNSDTLPAATEATTPAQTMTVFLCFADSTGKYLVKEQRVLPRTVSVARETVTQWLKGPAAEGTTLQPLVPTTTTLLDIAIKGNVAIVDLSKEFLEPNAKVSHEVALYGLVNTLTQFSTIKQVQIRIAGKPLLKYGPIDATMLVNKASLEKGASSVNPIAPNNGTGNTSSDAQVPAETNANANTNTNTNTNNEAPPKSPSSINLFNYPLSTT